MHAGLELMGAEACDGVARLTFRDRSGAERKFETDHVIAGTGYKIDVDRLSFLNKELVEQIAMEEKSPRLSTNFETSLPGLYFTGPCAAYSFGPLLRFAFGAGFASRHLSRHLYARARRSQRKRADQSIGSDLSKQPICEGNGSAHLAQPEP